MTVEMVYSFLILIAKIVGVMFFVGMAFSPLFQEKAPLFIANIIIRRREKESLKKFNKEWKEWFDGEGQPSLSKRQKRKI